MLRKCSLVFLAGLGCAVAVGARAEAVKFKMTGTVVVDDSFHVLPSDVHTGAPFTAFVSWDTSVPDQEPDPAAGYFSHPAVDPTTAPYGLSVQIGSELFRADTSANYIITTALADHDDVVGSYTMPLLKSFDYPPSGFVINDRISLTLQDLTGTALISDALPTFLDSDKFGYSGIVDDTFFAAASGIGIYGLSPVAAGFSGPSYQIGAIVQYITSVPEPSGMSLAAGGLLSIALLLRPFSCKHRGAPALA